MNKRNYKSILSFLLSFVLLLGSIGPSIVHAEEGTLDKTRDNSIDLDIFREILREEEGEKALEIEDADLEDRDATLIVSLDEKAAKDYSNKSLEDIAKDENIVKKVLDSQEKYIEEVLKINKDAEIEHRYYLSINGFSVKAKYKDIFEIREIEGVSDVSEAQIYYKDMASVNEGSGVNQIFKDYAYDGEGKLIAVLDSGVDHLHKDMRIDDGAKIKLDKAKVNSIKDKKGIKRGRYFSKKVPFGYNYADENEDIKDGLVDAIDYGHGMHVAGIIGANCEDKSNIDSNQGVRGVAPNSQILAMKIFSNNPRNLGASESDIIMALEDSIALGSDVINMSFCMTAGFQDPSEGQQAAIRAAVEEGIVVVSAAGNAAYSTFPNFHEDALDSGTVGSPGLAKETIQVGSYENQNMVTYSMETYLNGEKVEIPYVISDHNPADLKSAYELVDCGLGKEEEIGDLDLKGKVGLVKRGELDFEVKKLNIQKKGAKAVIIYNSDGDENFLPFISTHKDVRIPTVFTNNSNGRKLLQAMKEGQRVRFTDRPITIPNYNQDEMSVFSSWGPTPNLDLKPDLVATGGNVWSTVNDDSYKNMSGTSMATPFTSGISALLLEHIEGMGLNFTEKQDKVNYIKTLLMNTADIGYNKENKPYSPRLQGAGIVNALASLDNKVFLTADGKASVSLGEIKGDTSINLKVDNRSDKKKSYTVKVLSDSFKSDIDGKTIELNPLESIDIKTSININTKKNTYVEGFILLEDRDEKAIDISIPILGFYGDWANLPMFDKTDKDESIYKHTGLYTAESDGFITQTLPLGGEDNNPDFYAINPKDPKSYNNVLPTFSLLRNAKRLVIDVTNEDGEVVKFIEDRDNLRKEVAWEQEVKAKVNFEWLWRGTAYDKNLGIQKPLDEGQYYINVRATPDFKGAKEQVISMPLKIDTTAPTVNVEDFMTDGDSCDIEIEAFDDGVVDSGIKSFVFMLNGKKYERDGGPVFYLDGQDNIYKHNIKLDERPINVVDLGVTDHANNMTGKRFYIISSKYSKIDLSGIKDEYENNGEINFAYNLDGNEDVEYEICLNDVDNVIYKGKDKNFNFTDPIIEGEHRIIVKAINEKNQLVDMSFKDFKVKEAGDLKEELIIDNISKNQDASHGSYYKGELKINNNRDEDQDLCLILALYDENNEMLDVAVNEKTVKAKRKSIISTGLLIPEEGNYKLRLMLWDSLEDMNSLMDFEEITISK